MYWSGLGTLLIVYGALRWDNPAIAETIDRKLLPGILLYVCCLTVGVGLAAEVRRWRDERG
jgi:hypothetical protein